jgi:hypothetical protein
VVLEREACSGLLAKLAECTAWTGTLSTKVELAVWPGARAEWVECGPCRIGTIVEFVRLAEYGTPIVDILECDNYRLLLADVADTGV